jgi:imidazolonepropionase-like amidohydrolase
MTILTAITLVVCLLFSPRAMPNDVLFINARLLTMADGPAPSPPTQLFVRNDRIAAIGTALVTDEDTLTVDLAGGYLMPGLAEMHAHVPGNQTTQYRDDVLFLYVANGVTTARGMLGSPDHLELREALERQETLGPRLFTSGPSFNGNSVSSPDQASAMVRSQAAAGYDFLKIHPGLSRAEYDAMATTAAELDIAFAGHVPADVGLLRALAAGQASIDHLDGYIQALVPDLRDASGGLFALELLDRTDAERIELVVRATREAGAWVVPTETLLENFAAAATGLEEVEARPQNVYLPGDLRASYRRALTGSSASASSALRYLDLRKRLLRTLHQQEVGILLGSDAPQIYNVPGFSAHRELESMVTAGLGPFDALKSGTVNPAEYFGLPGDFGVLAPGAAADLIWLRDNPLSDIRNTRSIQGVMVRGRWLDRHSLDTGLAAIARRNAD